MTLRLSSILLLHSRALLDNVGTVLARKNGVAVLVELELDHLNLFNVNVCEGYGKYTRTAATAYGHVLLRTDRVQLCGIHTCDENKGHARCPTAHAKLYTTHSNICPPPKPAQEYGLKRHTTPTYTRMHIIKHAHQSSAQNDTVTK